MNHQNSNPIADDDTITAVTVSQPAASLLFLPNQAGTGPVKQFIVRPGPTPNYLVGATIAVYAAETLRGFGRHGTITTVGDYTIQRDAAGLLMRGPHMWPYRLPRSELIGTVTVDGCYKLGDATMFGPFDLDGDVILTPNEPHHTLWQAGQAKLVDIGHQLPYDNWQPGRWAWKLSNPQRLTRPIRLEHRTGMFTTTLTGITVR